MADLRAELTTLYEDAGSPSLEQLVVAATREGCTVSRSALHNLLRGTGRPRLATVESFVVACVAHARTRRPRILLSEEVTDLARWRALARPPGPEPGPEPVVQALARYFVRAVERAGVPHYLPTGMDPLALDQPRRVSPAGDRGRMRSLTPVFPWRPGQDQPRVVLLADAGLGKTWLLRMEARRLADEVLSRPAERSPVPVLLRCGDLAGRSEATLASAVTGRLTDLGVVDGADGTEVLRLLASRRITLLLDAYDELPGHAARSALCGLLGTAPDDLRIVLASRWAGYTGPPPTGGGPAWAEYRLDAFGQAQTEAVIRTWPLTEAARASVRARIATPSLAGLGNVPLLLALLCSLTEEVPVGGGESDLPASKGELYERMLRRFLVHEQRPPAADDTEADRLLGVLAPIAFHFAVREGGWTDVMPREEMLRAIRGAGAPFTELGQDAARVLRTLSVDAGVLQPPGDPSGGRSQPYLFAHRSFAEYLTARHLAAVPEAKCLAVLDTHLADGGRWEDTLVMLGRLTWSGPGGRGRFERMLEHLLADDRVPGHGNVLHAVRMLGDLDDPAHPGQPLSQLSAPLTGRLVERFLAAVEDEPYAASRVVGSCRTLPDTVIDPLLALLRSNVPRYSDFPRVLARHAQASVTAFLGMLAELDRGWRARDAVEALTHRADAESLRWLLKIFRNVGRCGQNPEEKDPYEAAVRALRARRDPAALTPTLVAAQEGPTEIGPDDWMPYLIRHGAVEILGGYPDAAATKALLTALKDSNPGIRRSAASGLADRSGPDVRAAVQDALRQPGGNAGYLGETIRATARSVGIPEADLPAPDPEGPVWQPPRPPFPNPAAWLGPSREYPPRLGSRPAIPEKTDSQATRPRKGSLGGRPPGFSEERYKKGNVVARTINRLKHARAVATRYHKRGYVFLGTVTAAALVVWLRT
ncbi:NACHT domain-containing protein [Streptomyces sp. NPDC058964]|uniref:NACHT domain-containing protein n=1 Tax=Streptomyces sp. NPDC058964 TaxID=3346681 RepID=UPI00368B9240